MSVSQIRYLNVVELGRGALQKLAAACQEHGIRRPLIVTDKGVRAAGLVDKALAQLGALEHVAVYDGTPSNPTEAAAREACALARQEGCDGLVAVGGGSAIDCAKAVAILVTHDGPLARYATIEGGSGLITPRVWPLIAVPTTAGTGSEVARGAIVIVQDGRKLGFHAWHLMPKVAVLDPELTLGLPPLLTAATGMDAIAHCMEAFMASAYNPPADGIVLDGLERGWAHIERATRNGQDVQARTEMLSASMQGAMGFQKGLGCVHSLSHSLGGVDPRLHHGTLNAMFLPAVIEFNAQAESVVRDRRLQRMARAMGLADLPASATETQAAEAAQAAQLLGTAIRAMNQGLGLPSGLAAMGVSPDCFERVIDGAIADHCHKLNPRLASREDYRRMLEASM